MNRTARTLALVVTATVLGAFARPAAAQDSMIGYKAGDDVRPDFPVLVYSPPDPGSCEIKKAKFLLESASVDGSPTGPPAYSVCYTVKCEEELELTGTVPGLSALGATHALDLKKPKLLCLPFDPALCGDGELNAGETCDGTAGVSCAAGCAADCDCTPTACGATTGGFCWFLSAPGANCEDTCTSNGRSYGVTTETYAGSSGTDAHCAAVLAALGDFASFLGAQNCAALSQTGTGCRTNGSFSARCTAPPTTGAATNPGSSRACACE